ncbi:MAG: hypothetical protein NTV86_11275 [Planctomycetota bacterium]|nr:hypothetical protein [Planctomycetota bacterium]
MAKLLTDSQYAVRGRLMAIDNAGPVGPLFTLRIPPATGDINRPGTYIDFVLLDTHRKTLQKRIHLDDELEVIIHVATAALDSGTRDETTFELYPAGKSPRISYCRRTVETITPVNGKVVENDAHNTIVVDAGVPLVVSLLSFKPTDTRKVKINSWVTFWPSPPTHGIILGKL